MTVKDFFRQTPRAAAAFSGGTDSALLLYLAKQNGCDVHAYYVKTAFQPEFELEDARRLAGELDIPMTVVELDILAVPEAAADDAELLERTVRVISSGCAAGTLKGRDMVPHADMALNIRIRSDVFPRVDLDLKTALQFLRRESFALPEAEKGYVMVSYGGAPLGFVKNIGSRCNNLHPAERRIRMDIKEVDNF